MATYLTYAPFALVIVWLYLVYNWFKSQRDFQNETGINPFSPIQTFKFIFNPNKNEFEKAAFAKMWQRSWKHLKIWILSILIFIVVTVIVGIITARQT